MPHLRPSLAHWLLIHLLIVLHLALVLPVLHPHLVSVLHALLHRFKLPLALCDARDLPPCLAQQFERLLLAGVYLLALLSYLMEHVVPLFLPSAGWNCVCCQYLGWVPWAWAWILSAVGPRP